MDEIEYQKAKLKRNVELLKTRQTENVLLKTLVKDYELFEQKLKEKESQREKQEQSYEDYLSMISAYIKDIMETN